MLTLMSALTSSSVGYISIHIPNAR